MDHNHPSGEVEGTSMIPEKAAEILVERVVPKVTDYGKMLFKGRKFLILGPSRSGKSSFLTYLELLYLLPEKPTPKTGRIITGDDRTLKLDRDGNTLLRVRKPRDAPGQPPGSQIEYVKEYTPHCIFVVLDSTKLFSDPPSDDGIDWLREFCQLLNDELMLNGKVRKKLRSMTVVMNKWDKMGVLAKNGDEDQKNQDLCANYVREEVLDKVLNNSFYRKNAGTIDVLPCCLVSRRSYGEVLAKQLLKVTAASLSRR